MNTRNNKIFKNGQRPRERKKGSKERKEGKNEERIREVMMK